MIINASIYNSHWSEKTLSDLGTFKRGKSKHRPRNDPILFSNGKYPLVQTGEVKSANLFINQHSATYNDFGLKQSQLWPKDTLCITIAANIAETALLNYPMCFPDSVVGFNAFPDASSELFMHYVFTYIRKSIQSSASGSIQDNINIDYLTSLKFKVPPKPYQDKITAVLANLDKKIELSNRINAELEAMAKTLYDYWFVQFDFPDTNGKPYKTSGGKMVYNPTLKREIPEGWSVKTIQSIEQNIVTGKTPSKEHNHYFDGSVPFITIGDIRGNTYIVSTEETLSIEGANTQKNKFLPEDTICVSCIASPGLVGFVTQPSQTNQQINSVICLNSINRYFLYFAINAFFTGSKAKTGNTFANMNKEDFSNINLLYPELMLLAKFHDLVDSMFSNIKTRSLENQELKNLRDWLLPMLMNGQVTVKG
ncbi:MAG: restriction endonuclease subunit S [Methylophilus sp.]|nr:restriction endonuclease subunit S [Methylophilus sp.]